LFQLVNQPCALVRTACLLAGLLLSGCLQPSSVGDPAAASGAAPSTGEAVAVGGCAGWVDSGCDVSAGESITLSAWGEVVARCQDRWGQGDSSTVGPEGTFLVSDGIAAQQYPLPAGSHGPAPCFALIGRVGDSEPFFVGELMSRRMESSGRLYLAVNDFAPELNTGDFYVRIARADSPAPLRLEQRVVADAVESCPPRVERVVVFYVDGLRPDVVQEMAAMGHLPWIRHLFLDNGVWMSNAFTAFPSDTITSNGTMWTGCFSDRHGLKGQVRFSRARLQSESYLETLGPGRSSRLLAPQGIDWLVSEAQARARGWTAGADSEEQWRRRNSTGTPAIYDVLGEQNQTWSTGLLPLMTELPPLLWTRSMSRELPWFHAHDAWQFIDDANTNFAMRHLIHRDNPVTVLWLPETDSVSHKRCRGQFGETRRTIAQADRLIGQVIGELRATERLETTTLLLVSDHGHHGGQTTHIRHFDLASDLFFRPREVNGSGEWVGGGLGLSVRMHRFWNRHPEHHQREFVFVDGDSDGAARIFMPRKNSWSRDWSGPNLPGDLLSYGIAPGHAPVDMVQTLVDARGGCGERAIDLVLMRLNSQSILVATADRGQAVIDRQCLPDGRWVYRYRPVRKLCSDGAGGVLFEPDLNTVIDPLGLASRMPPQELAAYHDETQWLRLTASTAYPDSVVSLTRHMLWQDNLAVREPEFAPDLVVTARPGWYFGTSSTPGTTHGYPLADAARASFFVSGPGVRRGARIDTPCRLVDLTPTILDMLGVDTAAHHFDGHPLRSIYQPAGPALDSVVQAVTWDDVDLKAWGLLAYEPIPESPHRPASINRPNSPVDLNNAVYSVAAIADASIFRVFDDVMFPLENERPGTVQQQFDEIDTRMRRNDRNWVADGARTLNLPETALSDYSLTSLGNLRRADEAIDWVQHRSQELDRRIAQRNGKDQTRPGATVNLWIDRTQWSFWEVYRFGQRLVLQIVDETVMNGVENAVDGTINGAGKPPAEIRVE